MSPLQKAPRVPDRGRETERLGEMVQAGRSESLLTLERETNPFDTPSMTPVASRRASANSNFPLPTLDLSNRRISAASLNRRSSYIPAIPSPLNPSSSQASVSEGEDGTAAGDSSNRDSSSSGDVPRSQSSTNISSARGKKGANASIPQQLLRQKSAPALWPGEIPRPETPKTLKDLGRDYTRYPLSSTNLRATSRALDEDPARSQTSLLRTTTNNPFSDSQADLEKWGYPDDSIGAFDPYHPGEKGFILYNNELEADDKFHMPADDDDITYKAKMSDYFDRRTIVSTIGGIFLVIGLLCVFILLPILTFTTNITAPGGQGKYVINKGPAWAHVNDNSYALLKNVRTGLIDSDTPASAMTRKSTFDSSTLNLVFSDEFNDENRTFYPGDDPYWTGANFWYGATQDFEWYDPDAVTTGGGTLQMRLDKFANHGLDYRSGMLNSWNQMCFKGGVFEVSVSLAGPAGVPGLWPGAWTMGNLGRPGYKSTTDGVWPYTYNSCDVGITPNQSDASGLSHLPGQRLNSCTCKGQDHPSAGTGRGAPEIDILEASVDPNNRIGVVTQSFQVAPFDNFYRPNNDFMAIPNYETTQMNTYCGGPFQQAISGTTLLNNSWYDGNNYQKYAFEYTPGTSKGKIAWFVGEDPTLILDGRAIGPNGNVATRQISEEPMSMILNLGFSASWTQIFLEDLVFPTVMHVDYVRIYQKEGQESTTCDPPGYPTTDYIAKHPVSYNNPNLTLWSETGYDWPTNKLTGC
ncbi:putative beta-glucan synthesis-associated protein [Lachnellula suecica]|uniref:Putative beta-glucan synthesis-associated protein n=1 Tax=Lachnellula suecica TaxID=602035 RepID=A0A8T9CAX9_9HELO|nr:putative beta-glucan synthesis-associated protein [Lachnellula suecica]